MKSVQIARAPWSDAVFVCRKCARKADAKRFRKALKRALKDEGARRVRVVETGCLDLCPKKRIVVAHGDQLSRRRLLVVAPDGANDVAAILARRGESERALRAEQPGVGALSAAPSPSSERDGR